jgi:hypothetical protein
MQPIDVLIGEWTTEIAHPDPAYNGITGRQRFEPIVGGKFLLQTVTVDHPHFPDSVSVLGSDECHYFDSRGVIRTLHLTLADGTLKLWREDPDFWQRFTATISPDATEMTGTHEMSHDEGATWEHDFEVHYRKVDN